VPSSASEVSATLSFLSSQWSQAQGPVTQQTDAQPFSALLEAASAAPQDATTAPAGPPPPAAPAPASPPSAAGPTNPSDGPSVEANSGSSTPAITSSPPAKGATNTAGTNAGGGNAVPNTSRGKNAKAQAASGGNAANIPDPTPKTVNGGNPPPEPASGATTTSGANSTASAAEPAATNNTANVSTMSMADPGVLLPAAAPPAKTSGREGKADAGGSSATTDADVATGAENQAPAPANPVPAQPIAAAVAVNVQINTAPAPVSAPAATTAIGEPTKGHARSSFAGAVEQNASSAQGPADSPAAAPTLSSAQTGGAAAASGSPDDGAKPQVFKDMSTPQAHTQTADAATTAPAQADAPVATDGDRAAPRAGDFATIASSGTAAEAPNAQSGAGAAKADTAGLPNFGFTASAGATSSIAATTAPPGTTSTAAVPISGLAVAITTRAQAGSNQFDIRLDPPELGRIDVRLDVNRDGQVTTHVTAERADTLDLLQSQQPQLERALQQAGLKTADNGLQFTLRDQSFAGQNHNGSGAQQRGAAELVIPDPDLAPAAATQIYARAGLGSGVDIRV